MSGSLPSLLSSSPDAYVQKIDLVSETALLVRFSESAYREASFLDDRILTPGLNGGWMRLSALLEAAGRVREARPLHFILHTGHVGSTLVSRLLDESGCVLSLREPLPLRTLADAQDTLEQPESLLSSAQFDALQDALLQLWSRGYDATRAVVVKATSSSCRIANTLLDRRRTAKAIYLNLGAEPYVATLLAGANSHVDLRGHGPIRSRLLQRRLGAPLPPLYSLSPGELAALSWVTETWTQRETASQWDARVLPIDFDDFLLDVRAGMSRIAEHFELPVDPHALDRLADSPVLTRYSKSPQLQYSPELRRELLADSRRRNGEEIGRALRWIEDLEKLHPQVGQFTT